MRSYHYVFRARNYNETLLDALRNFRISKNNYLIYSINKEFKEVNGFVRFNNQKSIHYIRKNVLANQENLEIDFLENESDTINYLLFLMENSGIEYGKIPFYLRSSVLQMKKQQSRAQIVNHGVLIVLKQDVELPIHNGNYWWFGSNVKEKMRFLCETATCYEIDLSQEDVWSNYKKEPIVYVNIDNEASAVRNLKNILKWSNHNGFIYTNKANGRTRGICPNVFIITSHTSMEALFSNCLYVENLKLKNFISEDVNIEYCF